MDDFSLGTAADIPDEFKTILARLYKDLHKNGVSRDLFLSSLKTAGYTVGTSSLGRWVARSDTLGSAISQDKDSGNLPRLDREQRNVTSGMVLHENGHGKIASLESFQAFVLKYFGVKLSFATISRYMAEDAFTCRLVQKKGKSFVVNTEALVEELWSWVYIQDFRSRGIKRNKFASIDFTFTGHRTDRRTSFAPIGGPQPMVKDNSSTFTNCIVTNIWADSVNRTPSKLFTFNPAFRRDRNSTAKRLLKIAHLDETLDKYGISEDRIIYIGKDKGEMKKYARECPDLVRLFFEDFEVPPGTVVYSDEGNSFFDNGESVLLEVGFKKHYCYPSKVHQYISPNDNRLHGTAKQSWRNCGIDFSDDIESCIALLHYLDRDTVEHSKHWWDKNMIELTEEGAKELIGNGPCKLSHLHKLWKRSYEDFMNENNKDDK